MLKNRTANILAILAIVVFGFFIVMRLPKPNVPLPVVVPSPAPVPLPTPTPTPLPSSDTFGTEYTLTIGGSITLRDGLTVTLTKINDSRCPKDVQCIWAGELEPVLSVRGGYITTTQAINLGTVRTQSVTTGGYTFAVRSATETTAIIVVYRGISS